jgi:hypothetical protein
MIGMTFKYGIREDDIALVLSGASSGMIPARISFAYLEGSIDLPA